MLDPGRDWEVISIEGRRFPVGFRVSTEQLSLLRVTNGALEPAPFQIDERDQNDRFALPDGPAASRDEAPGVFDDNDLLVFAARDLGERAHVDGAVEIEVSDPLSDHRGWVYLRVGPPITRSSRDDVRYEASSDTIRARDYALGFGQHTPSFFEFAEPGGSPVHNLLDRVKARVTARILWGILQFRRDEEDVTTRVLAWKDGPIRIIRRSQMRIRIGFGLPEPRIVAEDFLTADTFQGPVLVRLPFDLRYVFGDLVVHIFLDFNGLQGYRIFAAGQEPIPVGCGIPVPNLDGVSADWFGMTGPQGTFVHAMRMSPTMRHVHRSLYLLADPGPDLPEGVAGNCPGVGYTLTGWQGVGRGTHRIEMIIHAFKNYEWGDEKPFLESLQHPLQITLTPPPPRVRRAE